jgi:uncharacterized membrane protein YcfT
MTDQIAFLKIFFVYFYLFFVFLLVNQIVKVCRCVETTQKNRKTVF